MSDFDSDDDLFAGLDEAACQALERPSKRPKFDRDASPEMSRLGLAKHLLQTKFGYTAFRHEQAAAIEALLNGQNALTVFPTGAGKSLCFQIPAIAFPEMDRASGSRPPEKAGVTLVVSPLIALMKDQVDALRRRGISADSIDSTKPWDQIQLVYERLRKSELRLLYCAPERLNNQGFLETAQNIPGGVRLLAVDEAHCVSEWGHSFRPDYLKVARFVDEIKAERVVCLTATATPKVAEDICDAFKIKPECVFKTTPYRPNLELQARSISGSSTADDESEANIYIHGMFGLPGSKDESDRRFEELFRFLDSHPGPTLIYVALREQADKHAAILKRKGYDAAPFHAGLKTEVKQQTQDDFMSGKIRIVCATIAFGMGIDKPDIRNIVHWDLSNTVEEYSQQIGRAGRDGQKSYCMFYIAPSAFYLREVFARGDLPSKHSLRNLIFSIFDEAESVPVGAVFEVSHYQQEKQFDIRGGPLSIIYATLELQFGYIRATTSQYTTYKFEPNSSYSQLLKHDKSAEAQAIVKGAEKKVRFYNVDVTAIAKAGNLVRSDIISKLNDLNNHGYIKLQTSGLQNRYFVVKQVPQSSRKKEEVVNKIYENLAKRESDALERGSQVMNLMTGDNCYALALAEHFGMGLPDGKSKCGHCTHCRTGQAVKPPKRPIAETTRSSIAGVLKATTVRDDPRFLARVAFGIRSPRVNTEKLAGSKVFRSLAHHRFEDLLKEFIKACGNEGNL